MKYFQVVQLFQSSKDVDDGLPDVVFVEVLLFLFILGDFVVEVAVVSELHDDAGYTLTYQRLLP